MIVVESLQVSYGAIRAVEDLSLTVAPGSIVALIGGNGAGKSSTLRAVGGLVRPARGSITVDDHVVTGRPAHKIARLGMRLVPEGGGVFATMSVEDNLLTGLTGTKGKESGVEAAYERFPVLAERRRQLAGSLSGGERQMLAIGRALIARPRYLLLDEPSLGLAPLLIAEIFTIVADLREQGIGVLLVEQNAEQALRIADQAHVLEAGTVVQSGTGDEVRRDAGVVDRYLGAERAPDGGAAAVRGSRGDRDG
ncbi:ABC transporter ATP-binding protein [Sphaerisporangium rubeum]|uniref:Branched-chain amino acid transport system ATP-binding protein n=1 Tax=Sphaerisporangium rubeum TaxID=321317 RepID=A0A7X0IGK2_9ACTN|nr:ABC transporter ATP-binding protein [Sphaerisporangium rubeum]MBB6473292.1 branched-chain amino acid transport system ATP-binding protein [Sphaerisporangium rubeum]